MPRLSLILTAPADFAPATTLAGFREAAEQAGHEVEILHATSGGAGGNSAGQEAAIGETLAESFHHGLASAVIAALREASGDLVAIIDTRRGYEPPDLLRLLGPLEANAADVAIGSRHLADSGVAGLRGWLGRLAGAIGKPVVGTTDPLTGLIVVGRPVLDEALATFQPIGDGYSLELLSKLRGRWVDIAVPAGPSFRYVFPRFDGIRHVKRLADHRFGNFSRLLQFCVVGASGMVIDLSCYALLQTLLRRTPLSDYRAPVFRVHLDLAVAGLMAILIAMTWNFFLNRRLTFNDSRGGSILRQYLTYAISNALGISLSLSLRLLLPKFVPFFGQHRLMAALVGIICATGVSFLMARWLVFNPGGKTGGPTDGTGVESSPPQSVIA